MSAAIGSQQRGCDMTHAVQATLTYDEMPTARWYRVDGQLQPMYLREKRRATLVPPGGQYTFSQYGFGPRRGNEIVITDLSWVHALPGPRWWPEFTGDADVDIEHLAYALVDTRIDRPTDEAFGELVQGTKLDGVALAYGAGLGLYASIDAFAQACSDLTDWAGSTSAALDDIYERRRYVRTVPTVQFLDESTFRSRVTGLHEIARNANQLEWDVLYHLVDGGMWTDHMSTCITVGLTALSANRATRYNLMLHSFGDFTGTQILQTLPQRFGTNGLPAYDTLVDIGYYVVGGAPDAHSIRKANQLLAYLNENGLPVLGVRLTVDREDAGLAKAVMIAANGTVCFTSYRPAQ
jgi:hypothetical protein